MAPYQDLRSMAGHKGVRAGGSAPDAANHFEGPRRESALVCAKGPRHGPRRASTKVFSATCPRS